MALTRSSRKFCTIALLHVMWKVSNKAY